MSRTWSVRDEAPEHARLLTFVLLVPCFLISCLTILGFLLAPDSGEKLTLRKSNSIHPCVFRQSHRSIEITILLSVVTFSLLISDIMPPSSTAIPVITVYFLCVMCMSTISVAASVLVISLHFRNAKNYTLPSWVSAAAVPSHDHRCVLDSEVHLSLSGVDARNETARSHPNLALDASPYDQKYEIDSATLCRTYGAAVRANTAAHGRSRCITTASTKHGQCTTMYHRFATHPAHELPATAREIRR